MTNVDGSRVAESTHEIRPWRKGSDTCTFLLAGGARGPGSRRYEETSAVAHAPPRKFVQCNAIQQSQSIYASENFGEISRPAAGGKLAATTMAS